MNIEEVIKKVQKKLGVSVDGKAGPETWEAIYQAIVGSDDKPAPRIAALNEKVDDRSERAIATLCPEVRPYARSLVLRAAEAGITIKVISGTRTYEEQNALYAQGRTKPGPIVTKARGGYSNHNFGIAFDVGVFESSKYLGESPKYKAVGVLGEELGLEWGGNWKTFQDAPHFQLRPAWAKGKTESAMLAELRRRRESGQTAFA